MLFAYLGPETTLPIASFLAGAVGFVLMFWRQMKRVAVAWICKVVPGLKKDARPVVARASRQAAPKPHFGHVSETANAEQD